MIKQYLKLLMAREGKEVLGKGGSNLWILTLVLVATFASIAFSEGSMTYLKDKMEDPFTNWVNIEKGEDQNAFISFRNSLNDPELKKHYQFTEVLQDQYADYTFTGIDSNKSFYLRCRFLEQLNTPIVHAILSKENVIDGCIVDTTLLGRNSLGLILSFETAKKLGYDGAHLPTYINFLAFSEGADSLGVTLIDKMFKPLALPIIAVVKRLPNNVDIVASSFFYEQQHLNLETSPFNFYVNEEYQHQLNYYVSDAVGKDSLTHYIANLLPDTLKEQFQELPNEEELRYMRTWKPGMVIQYELCSNSFRLPRGLFQEIAQSVDKKFSANDVTRIYKFNTKEYHMQQSDYLSISFASLDSIRSFERFAKDEYRIQLEMAQVSSKENFNAVTVMAAILSAAMVIFSIVCIIMFLVNMLQSYFQKVKRNLGTFKAFGMNTKELTVVYIILLIQIVLSAMVLSLLITWGIQMILPMAGVEKEGFNYLSLWNNTTYIAAVVVLISTVVTVIVVMAKMLSQTPGDLIYERN